MATVSSSELNARLSDYVARARAGEVVIVTDGNEPVAQLIPLDNHTLVEEELRSLARQGVIQWSGGKPTGIPLSEAPRPRRGHSVSDFVLEQREDS